MSVMKRLVCLANSRKLMGRCVAGKEWLGDEKTGEWIRPVSERETQEVSEYERQYEDGRDPAVLDIIDVPMKGHDPEGHQSENWLIEAEEYWEKVGTWPSSELLKLVDPIKSLWVDGHSTKNGENDRIPMSSSNELDGSLRFLAVDELDLEVMTPDEVFGNTKRRVQGKFSYAGENYALWVTDPTYEKRYLRMTDGTYNLGECFVTVSLGEPFRGSIYKLIAAIIEKNVER